jgi:hypothetical protein
MRKKRSLLVSSVLAFFMIAFFFTACQKSGIRNQDSQPVAIYLTDHPGEFENVFLDITKVEAKVDSSKRCKEDDRGDRPGDFDHDNDDHQKGRDEYGAWQTLSFRAGSYDVLTLRNGVDTLLATGTVPGTLRKIRITVSAVRVVKNGVTYPVELVANGGNYLYVHVRKDHMRDSSGVRKLHIDFDVARSIIEVNGRFILRPVLRPFSDHTSGTVEGVVMPLDAKATVKLYNATDTATALPGREGKYKIRGLAEGTYSVLITSANGYKDATLSNISVVKGRETKIPLITLVK